jgi:type IV pilus assembly protein PilW
MLNGARKGHRPAARQRGLSVIELLVGVAVGLFLVTGAISLFFTNMSTSRRTLADARVEQDLRVIGDLITRDLRRAGYWGNSINGTIAVGTGSATTPNPYSAASATASTSSGQVTYEFSRDATENDTLDANESFGFRFNSTNGTMEMQTSSGTWQPLNDPNFVRITSFSLTDNSPSTISLGYRCPTTCSAGTPNCPTVAVRRYDMVINAQSALDSTVVRSLETRVRLRNDQMTGQCS